MSYTNSARYRTVRETIAALIEAGYGVTHNKLATGDTLSCVSIDGGAPTVLRVHGHLVSNDDVVDLIAARKAP